MTDTTTEAAAQTSHIQTSLAAICAAGPCSEGIRKLLTAVGKTMSEAREDPTPMCLSVVLDSNGPDDALWVLDNACDAPVISCLFAADCSERVMHLFPTVCPNDSRPARVAAWEASLAAARASDAVERAALAERLRHYINNGVLK